MNYPFIVGVVAKKTIRQPSSFRRRVPSLGCASSPLLLSLAKERFEICQINPEQIEQQGQITLSSKTPSSSWGETIDGPDRTTVLLSVSTKALIKTYTIGSRFYRPCAIRIRGGSDEKYRRDDHPETFLTSWMTKSLSSGHELATMSATASNVSRHFSTISSSSPTTTSATSTSKSAPCFSKSFVSRYRRRQRLKNNHHHQQQQQQQQNHQETNFKHCVFVAVGSNLGDRYYNIRTGLDLLCSPDYDTDTYQPTKLVETSFLYHTAPMYVTDQPPFLNGVVMIETDLPPLHLLTRIKAIERDLGRNFTQIRNGPRPLDLDILLYYNQSSTLSTSEEAEYEATTECQPYVEQNSLHWVAMNINETDPVELIVPHPRIAEREFVLQPLIDLVGRDMIHPLPLSSASSSVASSEMTPNATTMNDDGTKPTMVTMGGLLDKVLESERQQQQQQSDTASNVFPAVSRLIPLPLGRYVLFPKPPYSSTLIMGILNVTPDSFSDGGQYNTNVEIAVDQAFQMVQDGATIIDIGGESTRPGAKEVPVEEQIKRIVPVIKAIRAREQYIPEDENQQVNRSSSNIADQIKIVDSDVFMEEKATPDCSSGKSSIIISVDTRHADVARAAIEAGADIVNDVSGGTFDPMMLSTVAELRVPIILMHMRGTPETMQQMTDYRTTHTTTSNSSNSKTGVVDNVVESLLERSEAASLAGIPRWMQILDVGIGFAKDFDGNLSLLTNYKRIRTETGGLPLLLGASRKGFLGKITGETVASDRDAATIGSCIAALCLGTPADSPGVNSSNTFRGSKTDLGCNILRVHNVKAVRQATMVMDAIVNNDSSQ